MPNDFFYDYFIDPILSKTGYNSINTLTYAIIAIIALYAIYTLFKKYNIKLDRSFVYSILPFVLLGSTMRVVTDSIDNGVFKAVTPIHELVINSHLYDYGYITVSPGIYLVTAAILFISMFVLNALKKPQYLPHVGIALWIPHFLLLIPFMAYVIHAIPILILAIVPAFAAYKYFKNDIYALIVGGHALDGAATFWVIDIFGPSVVKQYFEQHVVGGAIGAMFGTFFVFYLVKVAIAFAVSYAL